MSSDGSTSESYQIPHMDFYPKMLIKPTALLVLLLVNLPQMSIPRPVNGHLVAVNGASSNWTGYEVKSSDNGYNYFSQVEATWTVHEPVTVVSGTEVLSEITTWVGLGGDMGTDQSNTTSVLWQAGTTNWNNRYQFWYEDYGCNNPCPENGYPVSVSKPSVEYGDRVKVVVKLDGTVIFTNLSSGESATYHVSIDNNHIGLSAEWISELTCTDVMHGNCVTIKFNSAHFGDAYAYGSRNSTYFDLMNYERFDLADLGLHLIAKPTAPLRHGFNVSCCMK